MNFLFFVLASPLSLLPRSVLQLAQDYGLEPLAMIPPGTAVSPPGCAAMTDAHALDDENVALQRFAEHALRTLAAMAPTDVVAVADSVSIKASCIVHRAPMLPLFFQTVKSLQQLVSDAIEEASAGKLEATQDSVMGAAADMLHDDADFESLVSKIEQSPGLFTRFLSDVLVQLLHFHAATPLEFDILLELTRLILGGANARPSCVRVLMLPRIDTTIPALSQALAILAPLRRTLHTAAAKGEAGALALLARACATGRQALGLPDLPLATASIVGAATMKDFGRVLTIAAIELCWQNFTGIASGAPLAKDDQVQDWISMMRPLLTRLGGLEVVRVILPPCFAARVVTMVVALRIIAHMPVSPAALVLQAVLKGLETLCVETHWPDIRSSDFIAPKDSADFKLTFAFVLRLLSHSAIVLQDCVGELDAASAAMTAATTVGIEWARVLEDVLRWGVASLASDAPGGAKAGRSAGGRRGAAASMWSWVRAGDFGGGGASAEGSSLILALLLGVGLPEHALGRDTGALRAIASKMPQRVRIDLMSGLLPLDHSAPHISSSKAARAVHASASKDVLHKTLDRASELMAHLAVTLGTANDADALYAPPCFAQVCRGFV
jgi:hypothetical protein